MFIFVCFIGSKFQIILSTKTSEYSHMNIRTITYSYLKGIKRKKKEICSFGCTSSERSTVLYRLHCISPSESALLDLVTTHLANTHHLVLWKKVQAHGMARSIRPRFIIFYYDLGTNDNPESHFIFAEAQSITVDSSLYFWWFCFLTSK
jgi:hypothetical protein